MRRVSGIEGAAYIWHDTITEILKNKKNVEFTKPVEVQEAWINPYTGALAKYKSRPNILEYFKAGTEPKDKTDLTYLKQF
jgi:membrane carboxypeptidase/penicillin-binding protein